MKPLKTILPILALIALAIGVTACNGAAGAVPTPAAIAHATLAPTASATTAPTETLTPTATASPTPTATATASPTATATPTITPSPTPLNPLAIESMRRQSYPGSDLVIEETLAPGANYSRYITSYKSEGLKIYALLTVPKGEKPATGWPVVIFNHGYIPPTEYRTTERYIAYTDAFSRNGYIVLKSDYRGHGSSEGVPSSSSISIDYTVDVLNAVASVKRFKDADPQRIGMWGHSMGGSVTLRAMVTTRDIKAGDIWAGVVGTYPQLFERWDRRAATIFPINSPTQIWRAEMVAKHGAPEANPAFWDTITPNAYVKDLSGPLLIQHGTADETVPLEFSETLYKQVKDAGKSVEIYTYPGDDHNIAANVGVALARSVAFFDKYVKGAR